MFDHHLPGAAKVAPLVVIKKDFDRPSTDDQLTLSANTIKPSRFLDQPGSSFKNVLAKTSTDLSHRSSGSSTTTTSTSDTNGSRPDTCSPNTSPSIYSPPSHSMSSSTISPTISPPSSPSKSPYIESTGDSDHFYQYSSTNNGLGVSMDDNLSPFVEHDFHSSQNCNPCSDTPQLDSDELSKQLDQDSTPIEAQPSLQSTSRKSPARSKQNSSSAFKTLLDKELPPLPLKVQSDGCIGQSGTDLQSPTLPSLAIGDLNPTTLNFRVKDFSNARETQRNGERQGHGHGHIGGVSPGENIKNGGNTGNNGNSGNIYTIPWSKGVNGGATVNPSNNNTNASPGATSSPAKNRNKHRHHSNKLKIAPLAPVGVSSKDSNLSFKNPCPTPSRPSPAPALFPVQSEDLATPICDTPTHGLTGLGIQDSNGSSFSIDNSVDSSTANIYLSKSPRPQIPNSNIPNHILDKLNKRKKKSSAASHNFIEPIDVNRANQLNRNIKIGIRTDNGDPSSDLVNPKTSSSIAIPLSSARSLTPVINSISGFRSAPLISPSNSNMITITDKNQTNDSPNPTPISAAVPDIPPTSAMNSLMSPIKLNTTQANDSPNNNDDTNNFDLVKPHMSYYSMGSSNRGSATTASKVNSAINSTFSGLSSASRSDFDSSPVHGDLPSAKKAGMASRYVAKIKALNFDMGNGLISPSSPTHKSPLLDDNQKRLRKKYNLLYELVSTEESFSTDVGVAVDIYFSKLSSEPYLGYVSRKDMSIMFSNLAEILMISRQFVASLRENIPSYILDLFGSKPMDGEALVDMDTNVGQVLLDYIPRMESIFQKYCEQSQLQMATFYRISSLACPMVDTWLSECSKQSQKISKAWTLDSLLIKPVQRLLKYPLLLQGLLQCTDKEHIDYDILKEAVTEMEKCADRINSSSESIDNSVSIDYNSSIGQIKSEMTADGELETMLQQFSQKRRHVKNLIRTLKANTMDLQRHFDSNNSLANSWLSWSMVADPEGKGISKEKQSLVERYAMSSTGSAELSTSKLSRAIEKDVVAPLHKVWVMYESTNSLITDRNRFYSSYSKYVNAKNSITYVQPIDLAKGDDGDLKAADLFIKYHNSLKDGLPELFLLTEKMISSCMAKFVEIQRQWFELALELLSGVFDAQEPNNDDLEPESSDANDQISSLTENAGDLDPSSLHDSGKSIDEYDDDWKSDASPISPISSVQSEDVQEPLIEETHQHQDQLKKPAAVKKSVGRKASLLSLSGWPRSTKPKSSKLFT